MIDFGKLCCDLHPNQIITNFCLKQTCMIGLCATCICTHTEYHVNNKSTPEYQNIRATFSSMHQMIRKKITTLDQQKQRINKITEFIKLKRKAVKDNIEETKKHIVDAINVFFDKKQKSMLREIQSEEKKMGLHSEARMESLMNSLSRETAALITSAQELNSQNFLQSYQRIKTQVLLNAARLQEDVSRQLDRNQDFQTIINTNDEYLHHVSRALEQSLGLSFKMSRRPLVPQQQKQQIACKEPQSYAYDKNTSRFGGRMEENFSTPLTVNRPSIMVEPINNFSAISFSNVPQMIKQTTAKFTDAPQSRQTSKSITLPQDEPKVAAEVGIQRKSFINDLFKSDIIKQPQVQKTRQSQIFKQKDTNQRAQQSQSLNKLSCSNLARNHQSQLITVDKPFGYQSTANWNTNNNSKAHYQTMNSSMIQNMQNYGSYERVNQNNSSQISYSSNRPSSVGISQLTGAQQSLQSGQKFSFVPQMFDATQFNKGNENQCLADCKKVRKSGLTVLKANSTSRTRLHHAE